MRRLLVVSLLSLMFVPAALVLQPSEAAACSCIPSPGPVQAAQSVDVVFHAKLVSVADAPPGGQFDIPTKLFTFDVIRTFKGQLDPQVIVSTADNSAACGRGYGEVGTEWLVYASFEETGRLHDNLCSRTCDLGQAAADIAELEANADKLDDEPEQPGHEDPGPAEPEPEPIQPEGESGHEAPEPTPKPNGCTVVDGTLTDAPIGGVAGLLTLGLGLGLLRRRAT